MPKTALIAGVTGQDGARVREFAFLDRPWVAVFTPEARRAGGRWLFLNRWPSLPDQLRGMRQSMDPDTGAILFQYPTLQGIPDLVLEGAGYTMEFMGRLLPEPIKQQFPLGLGHQPGGLLAVDGDRGAAAGHGRAAVPNDGEALCGCALNAKCM